MLRRLTRVFSSKFKGLLERGKLRGVSLRTNLVLLVLAAALPLLIFGAVMLWHEFQLQRNAVERGMRDTARALSLAVDREVGKVRAVLETLAASPHLDAGDFKSFYELSSRVDDRVNESWIVLFDHTGQQIINTLHPFGAPLPNPFLQGAMPQIDARYPDLPVGGGDVLKKSMAGQFAVSDMFVGLGAKRAILAIAVPVVRDGKVLYVLQLGIGPKALTDLLREQRLPTDWVAGIVDRKGILIARKVDPERFVGRPVSPELRSRLAQADEGWGTGRTLEGVPVYDAFTRSKLTGWAVEIGAPRAIIDAPVNRSIGLVGGGGMLLLLLALGAALALGRRISAPISSLASSAEAIQRGERVKITPSAVQEVKELYEALVAEGAISRERTEELRKTNAELIRSLAEQQKLEEELRQAQKMEAIGTLAGGIAHDFNNILAIIMGYASELKSDGLKPNEFSESIQAILDASQRGAAVVRQLLTFARTTAVLRDNVRLDGLLAEFVRMIQGTFPKTIELSLEIEADMPTIPANANEFQQAMLNLCINARDAMPEGGKITISAASASVKMDGKSHPGRRPGDYVCVSVTDTGVGMNEETRTRSFDPFFTTKEKQGGTGLGLAVVYGIVRNHGGFVDVESGKDWGTKFSLCFPTHSEGPALEGAL